MDLLQHRLALQLEQFGGGLYKRPHRRRIDANIGRHRISPALPHDALLRLVGWDHICRGGTSSRITADWIRRGQTRASCVAPRCVLPETRKGSWTSRLLGIFTPHQTASPVTSRATIVAY